ncbi:GNAT family N-acetyltransferase [Pseudoduganella buxea]|uniref:Alanine acetyltransferase n=1 Tax=Pseudoduganella buxea TaxID=1949069 RepID=A0A6I3SUA1_9BURK|nr:GNAT family protein [Pseudoduganella buxea]MTV52743.1 GNAT family N-acetyltransferase [Pseudoduganella buxea]GGC18509.1 alanine acetyltransferase [Pseudoduganella buxea]
MDTLRLCPLVADDAADLLAFELANRAWFERWVVPRDPSFYHLAAVQAAASAAQWERAAGTSYQYLLRRGDAIVGRVNLTGVTRPAFNKAALGYRIGEDQAGQGIATRAVALVLQEAFGPLGLWRLEANARPENVASVRVLERNGFRQCGRLTRSMQHDGAWFDQLLFERHADG